MPYSAIEACDACGSVARRVSDQVPAIACHCQIAECLVKICENHRHKFDWLYWLPWIRTSVLSESGYRMTWATWEQGTKIAPPVSHMHLNCHSSQCWEERKIYMTFSWDHPNTQSLRAWTHFISNTRNTSNRLWKIGNGLSDVIWQPSST